MKSTSEKYHEVAVALAELIGKMEDLRTTCELLKDGEGDTGDPYYDLEPALMHAGIALASAVTYADEYEKKELEQTETAEEAQR